MDSKTFIYGYNSKTINNQNSGSSYLNRVELQNGCLTLAHANLFIPSTLGKHGFGNRGVYEQSQWLSLWRK